jgi:D-alanyl-D-alanine carboxypeptidase (penicillin-binding protein 5/6)
LSSGFDSKNDRSKQSLKLLTYGLTNYDLVEISKKNQPFENIEVWLGKENFVKAYTKENIYKTIKKGQKKKLKIKVIYDGPIEAPIKKDQLLAKLKISYDNEPIGEYELLALKEIKKVNIFARLMKSLNYLIWGDV